MKKARTRRAQGLVGLVPAVIRSTPRRGSALAESEFVYYIDSVTNEERKRPGPKPKPPEEKAEPTAPFSVRLTEAEKVELQRRGIRGRPGTLAHWLATPIKGDKT